LRSGLKPVLRPNGSGAGMNALVQDLTNGTHNIDFARSSSAQAKGANYDSITLGTDILAMLTSSTTNAPTALTVAQLKDIYLCNTTDWNTLNSAAPVGSTIVPLVPQVGSGTRKSFLLALNSSTSTQLVPGACAKNVEENDPEAIDASGSAINAIEPMSSGRLNMYKGLDSAGVATGLNGYFLDPSCAYGVTTPAVCTAAGNLATPNVTNVLNPNVTLQTGTGAWQITRNLYIYFRHADVDGSTIFQPGGTKNWVRTLFYNPCSGSTPNGTPIVNGTNCSGGGLYGPGGAPFLASASGQSLISSSGIVPAYSSTVGGP
jgi:ABC-type phosphate transport system substrate-binding protein